MPTPSSSAAHASGTDRRTVCRYLNIWLLLSIGLLLVTFATVLRIAAPPDVASSARLEQQAKVAAQEIQQQQQRLSTQPRLHGAQLAAAIASHHPLNRLQCGSWVDDYVALHRTILAGSGTQRYAIMRSRMKYENGLADRLASSVSVFLYALLAGRAFQYDWEGDSPLWDSLRSSHIDWRYSGVDIGNDTLVLDYVDKPKGSATELEYFALFEKDNLTEVGAGRHSVVWFTDHARVVKAFDNPHLAARLAALGLRRETAFACLFDFLYRPSEGLLELFSDQLQLLLDPNVLPLGVQIRVGDWQLTDNFLFGIHKLMQGSKLFSHYLDCIAEIERELVRPGQRAVYYVLTDSSTLRYALQVDYGVKVLVNTGAPIEHISKSRSPATALGFQYAVGELWMFSLTRAQVITKKSGFGRVGAMVAVRADAHPLIFAIDYPMNFYNVVGFDNRKNLGLYKQRRCTAAHADSLEVLATTFTGI